MEQLVLNIKNKSKIAFLKEILKRMEFVEIVEPPKLTRKEKEFIAEFQQSVEWVNKHKAGKIKKSKSFQQLLDEL
jgi:hypothetical protein